QGIKGKVLFSSYPVEGSRKPSWFDTETPAKGSLDVYDFETQKQDRLIEGITDFWIGPDASTLLYRANDRLRVLKAGEKPPEEAAGGQFRIARIVQGDPWDEHATSPLNRPGVDVQVGDVVLAVNGQPVGGAVTPGEWLVHQADQEVLLTVQRGDAAPRTVVVK